MHSATADDDYEFVRGTTLLNLMAPLMPFLNEDGVTEVCINRPGEVVTEKGPAWVHHEVPELTLDACLAMATAIATYSEQEISARKPILSAMLPGGERVQIVVPPAVEQGSISFSIRRPSPTMKTLEQYREEGAFNRYVWAKPKDFDQRINELGREERMLAAALASKRLDQFLVEAVKAKKNIAVVGDTGSGKTTLMKTICQSVPFHERLVTIEDVRELFLPNHPNRVHLLYSKGGQGVAKVTPSDLISANMRMKPDRVLLAELRGGEAFDFLKLLTTGHSGSITSYHAESCALAAERYVFMCKEHEQASIYDADALKRLVTLTLDIIIHVTAKNVFDAEGKPIRKERYVEEVHYDPMAKLAAKYGNATVMHADKNDAAAHQAVAKLVGQANIVLPAEESGLHQ